MQHNTASKYFFKFSISIFTICLLTVSAHVWHAQASEKSTLLNIEVPPDDFRISFMGPDGSFDYAAREPAIAYNSQDNEYLIVWYGDDDTAPLINQEFEIFGQRVDADGALIGDNFRISHMGPDGDADFDAQFPGVAYNSQDNEYLIVWQGDDDTAPLVDEEDEIFGQRIDADGSLIEDNFRISNMGPDGDTDFAADHPSIAYNSQDNEYLVIWEGDDNTPPLVDDEDEIFGQRIDADGSLIEDNFRISNMGPDGDTAFFPAIASIAYNATDNEYMVVWESNDDSGDLDPLEFEIFGQRVAGNGTLLEGNFRISFLGTDGDAADNCLEPYVAYNILHNEYLVVWDCGEDVGDLVPGELEIFGQRIDADGSLINNNFQISSMGTVGNGDITALRAGLAYNTQYDEYLVVWQSDNDIAPLVDDENEVYAQRVDADGSLVNATARISQIGPDGDIDLGVRAPETAYNSQDNEYLIVWEGDDDTLPLLDDEFEIFGQRFVGPFCGDGELQAAAEECDDGNTTDGDGCSSTCETEEEEEGGGCSLIVSATSRPAAAIGLFLLTMTAIAGMRWRRSLL